MAELNLVLLGPPGSGKGTQGERLNEDLRLPYYATGDILRGAVRDETELGREAKEYMDRGDLVPDEVIVGVIAERIDSSEALDGFILDGFPRTTPQAEALDAKLGELGRAVTAVLLIDVSDDEVVRRLGGRRTCEENGHVFHVEFEPPKQDGVCDIDGSPLIVRDDDKPEVSRGARSSASSPSPAGLRAASANAAAMAAARARQSHARTQARPKPRAVAGGRRAHHGIRWDRISRLALLGVLFVLLMLFVGPARSYISTWQKSKHERAVVSSLKRENVRLKAQRAALLHPAVLEREARGLGMTEPGERVFVLRGLPK